MLGKLKNKQARLQKLDEADGGSRWGAAVKETLCELGPLFVKLGQNLANRPDLVNEDLMEELTKLQDRVPPFNSKLAFKIIEEKRAGSSRRLSAKSPKSPSRRRRSGKFTEVN